MARKKHNVFESLGTMLRDANTPPPPKRPKQYGPQPNPDWNPNLTPEQVDLFSSESLYILAWGEKGSGKTIGCLHKLVKHCFENKAALAVIMVRVRSMANKGGAWDKLQQMILPEWQKGLGLQYSDVQQDSQHNEIIHIQNEFGGWSQVVLISAPHANQLRQRIRGYEPSFVFVDELTSCDSEEYFTSIAAQIGRNPNVDTIQQYVAACNPEGQSHWVYQKWFVAAFDESTGTWDHDYQNIHFPIESNAKNLQPGYLKSLQKIYRDDVVEAARMIRGVWVDRPTGESLFREIYNPVIHVRPLNDEQQPSQFEWLLPSNHQPFIIGLDPGAVYSGFSFEQWVPLDAKMKWVLFDEVVVKRKRIAYELLIPIVMRRVKWWREQIQATAEDTPQIWISDNSAFNQFHAGNGSFDVLEIERIYEAHRHALGLEPMKIKPAPKFNGSKVTRVRLVQKHLSQDEIVVSARCIHHHQMFLALSGKKFKAGEVPDPEQAMTPQRSEHVHVFDSFSYPILTAALNPTALVPSSSSSQTLVSAA